LFAHVAQNVHSNVQIIAAMLSGGRSLSQHSQFGFSFIITAALLEVFQEIPVECPQSVHDYKQSASITAR
jgi:hypothetical protein